MRWTILTGELPPRCGGVGDYTAQLAAALASADDDVVVCVPGSTVAPDPIPRVELVLLPDRFGRHSRAVLDRIQDARRAKLLVQYVPNAFGARGGNLSFCRWLGRRRVGGDAVAVMFHEPYFYFGWHAPQRNALALVQRAMAALLLRAADEVYVSTSAWNQYLTPFAPRSAPSPITVPIPSTIPVHTHPATRNQARVVGHFGSYGSDIASLLRDTLAKLLESDDRLSALCMGHESEAFVRDLSLRRALSGRVRSTGYAPPSDIASAIAACDLMVQPYPDGVTTRRTTVMAGLANARPVLTTTGALTEALWHTTGAVALEAVDPEALVERAGALLSNPLRLADLAARGEAAYRAHFALENTVAHLRHARKDAAA
jgi:glycosyltransferase involved in cell wall biosynthesis